MAQKRETIYAFIDSNNLNLGTSRNIVDPRTKTLKYTGWKIDMRRFLQYLKDKFRVSRAFIFIGYMKERDSMYSAFREYGYDLVFKPIVRDRTTGNIKGNVDAELVLHAAKLQFQKYDRAIIVSGDGDFRCLHEHLLLENKLLGIMIPNNLTGSSLLKPFQNYKIFLQLDKEKFRRR